MTEPRGKQAKDTPPDASPINGVPPPRETRWKPGQSGNPSGLPKGTTRITDRLRRLVEKNDGEVAEALCKAIVKAGLKGDHRFVKEILDRLDGPVKQQIEGTMTTHYKVHRAEDVDGAV